MAPIKFVQSIHLGGMGSVSLARLFFCATLTPELVDVGTVLLAVRPVTRSRLVSNEGEKGSHDRAGSWEN